MTVRTAIDAAGAPNHGEAVARAVATARRRLRTVAMLQLAAIAGPGGVTAGAAIALAGWAPAWTPAALGLLGAAAAGVWAAVHTPPPATVARLLDTRLGLRDRVAAALQLQQTGGPIASLVARDAAARLERLDPAALFPLGLDRAAAYSLTAAVAMVVWLATTDREPPDARVAAGSGNASDNGDAPARAGSGSRPATPEPGQADSRRSAEPTREPRRGDAPGNTAALDTSGARGGTVAQAAAPPAVTSQQSASSAADRQQATGSRGADGAERTGRGGGSAAGRTANSPMATGAGGATRGSALVSASVDRATAARSAAAYRAARAGAEAALARDVIPPDYRDHVRAYFRALPATGTGAGGSR